MLLLVALLEALLPLPAMLENFYFHYRIGIVLRLVHSALVNFLNFQIFSKNSEFVPNLVHFCDNGKQFLQLIDQQLSTLFLV